MKPAIMNRNGFTLGTIIMIFIERLLCYLVMVSLTNFNETTKKQHLMKIQSWSALCAHATKEMRPQKMHKFWLLTSCKTSLKRQTNCVPINREEQTQRSTSHRTQTNNECTLQIMVQQTTTYIAFKAIELLLIAI